MKMLRDPLRDAALSCWPHLAAEAGINPQGWTPESLARREDARVSRVLLRMAHPDHAPVVLKHEARPVRPEEFMQAMAAHLAAHDGFPDGVPELLAFDVRSQSCVMEWIEAQPLSVALSRVGADHGALLQRAGTWIAGFHRAGAGEARTFQPKFTIRYLRRIMDEVRSGQRKVIQAEQFLRCAEHLCAMQPRFEGQETLTAQTHGDLHMRNILVGRDRVWGIDFAGGAVVPMGHDLARVLVDYATLRAPHDAIPEGDVLPRDAMRAFFAGYDLVGPQDPSVQLLLRHRVLADWWGLPLSRSAAQERRLKRLMSLVSRVFAEPLRQT